MALLEFARIGYEGDDCRPMVNRVFRGLQDLYDFQKEALNYLKTQRVIRAAWKLGEAPLRRKSRVRPSRPGGTDAVWVELVEWSENDDPDELLEQFLDADSNGVYEAPAPPDGEAGARVRPRRPRREHQLEILDGDTETNQLLLSRKPELPHLLVWPNTNPLERQLDALHQLSSGPRPHHGPLLRLFERAEQAEWPTFAPKLIDESDWYILRDGSRPGTASQREFVCKAAATPDFAILEGPPGSGKTTAICELILQIVRRTPNPGRVLLCASTHVAVDNVLERLTDTSQEFAKWINPVRIGDEVRASPSVQRWLPEARRRTDTDRLKSFLRTMPDSPARRHLSAAIDEQSVLQRMMLETSNVVCGTTIGILRLKQLWEKADPTRARGSIPDDQFDLLIVDEASKTSFQEFLVPALLAKRWVLIGDPRQLSPYVDQEALEVNLEACVPDHKLRNACVDVFLARPDRPHMRRGKLSSGRQRPVLVVTDDEKEREFYRIQATERGVACARLGSATSFELAAAGVILASHAEITQFGDRLPLDVCTLRGGDAIPDDTLRRVAAWRRESHRDRDSEPSWAGQVGYRLLREYEQRFRVGGGHATSEADETDSDRAIRMKEERKELLPAVEITGPRAREELLDSLGRVRRVAFPSTLETLQFGYGGIGDEVPTTMTHGFPRAQFQERHVLLEHQHRMHPEIAEFPRAHVYGGEALITDPSMASRREWSYEAARSRARWLNVTGPCPGRQSRVEAEAVVFECGKFVRWAAANPRPGGVGADGVGVWEVAVLSFYRAQERLLLEQLRECFGTGPARHRLEIKVSNRLVCVIKLATVDRFQGQEADVVLLSIANNHSTVFLESLNRLNVALTRARYLLLVVGNRQAMGGRRSEGTLMHCLATSEFVKFEDRLKERSHVD